MKLCDTCLRGKSTRDPGKHVYDLSTFPLDFVHVDGMGTFKIPSLNRAWYFIALYDDSCALSIVQFTKTNSASADLLRSIMMELESIFNVTFKRICVGLLRTDNSKNFLSKNMREWLDSKKIIQETSS